MSLTHSELEGIIGQTMLRIKVHFPGCKSSYENNTTIHFRKNDAEWFRIKFTPHPCTGYTMMLTGPKRINVMDLEANVGDFGGDTLCFPHMEEEKYVLRLVRKYFIECGYESEDDM